MGVLDGIGYCGKYFIYCLWYYLGELFVYIGIGVLGYI